MRPGDIIVFWYAVDACFYGYFQRILLIVVLVNSWDAFNEISLAPKKKFPFIAMSSQASRWAMCHSSNRPAHFSASDRPVGLIIFMGRFSQYQSNLGQRYKYEIFAFHTNIPNGHLRLVSRNKCRNDNTKHIFYSGAHYSGMNGKTKWNDNKRDLSLWTYDLCDNQKRKKSNLLSTDVHHKRFCGCTE